MVFCHCDMTENYVVIKRFKPFILGFCKCGCGTEIELISKHRKTLKMYAQGHLFRNKNGGIFPYGKKYKRIYKPNHPFASSNGSIIYHRYLLEQYYSKKFGITIFILPCIHVHHKDGNTHNNEISNLELIDIRTHQKIHRTGYRVDHSKTFCLLCKSKKTTLNIRKSPRWHKYKDSWICDKCYQRVKTKEKNELKKN